MGRGRTDRVGEAETAIQRLRARVVVTDMEVDRYACRTCLLQQSSQRLAARALGLSHVQTLRRVVLPQALRKMTPALMNDFISMQKDVGLISIIAGIDAIAGARSVTATTYNFTPYVVAGILFILLAIPTIRLADWYTARLREREQTGSVL